MDEILKLSEDFKIAYEIYINELQQKSEKMPATKKKYVLGDNLRNVFFKHQYGMTIDEYEQQKSQIEQSLIQGVLKLYLEKKWDIPTIADVFSLDVEQVKKIIASKKIV